MRKFWRLEPAKLSASPFNERSSDSAGSTSAISDERPDRLDARNLSQCGDASQHDHPLPTGGNAHIDHGRHMKVLESEYSGAGKAHHSEFVAHDSSSDSARSSLSVAFVPFDPPAGAIRGYDTNFTNPGDTANLPAHQTSGAGAPLAPLVLSVVFLAPKTVPIVDAYPIDDGENLPAVPANPIIDSGSPPVVTAYPINDGESFPDIHWDGLIHAIISLYPLPIDMSAPTPISDGDSLPAFPDVDYGHYTVPELIELGFLSAPVPGLNPDMIW